MKIFALGFCLLLVGCTGYQYVAPPQYVPVSTEKGQLNANFSINSYQVGYAFSNHFSLFTTGYCRYNDGGFFKSTVFTKENGGAFVQTDKQKEIDLGATYFNKLDKNFSYEVLSGIGIGSVDYSNNQDLDPNYEFAFDVEA